MRTSFVDVASRAENPNENCRGDILMTNEGRYLRDGHVQKGVSGGYLIEYPELTEEKMLPEIFVLENWK